MKHKVEIIETLSRIVEVEAQTPDDAIDIIADQYNNEGIVLDATDYNDVEINIQE
jgi:hypothetical protein